MQTYFTIKNSPYWDCFLLLEWMVIQNRRDEIKTNKSTEFQRSFLLTWETNHSIPYINIEGCFSISEWEGIRSILDHLFAFL